MYMVAAPPAVGIGDPTLGTAVLALGLFIVIVGIIIGGVVYRESREWRKLVLPMFDRDLTDMSPESGGESGGLTPRTAAFGKEILSRVFSHMDVAGLLGGAATVVLGILIVLIGLALSG